MGTWGSGIFCSDLAEDLRSEWEGALLRNGDEDSATLELEKKFKESISDPDEASVFYLALANLQYLWGRPVKRIYDKALCYINDNEGNFQVNFDSLMPVNLGEAEHAEVDVYYAKQRKQVLLKLKRNLEGEQKKPRKIPKLVVSNWKVGDCFSMSDRSLGENREIVENYYVFRVCSAYQQASRSVTEVELLDRRFSTPPRIELVGSLKPKLFSAKLIASLLRCESIGLQRSSVILALTHASSKFVLKKLFKKLGRVPLPQEADSDETNRKPKLHIDWEDLPQLILFTCLDSLQQRNFANSEYWFVGDR